MDTSVSCLLCHSNAASSNTGDTSEFQKPRGAETVAMEKESYGDNVMCQNRVYRRQKRLRGKRHLWAPVNITFHNVKKLRNILNSDLSVRILTHESSVSKSNVDCVVTEDLEMWKTCLKMAPRSGSKEELNFSQRRVEVLLKGGPNQRLPVCVQKLEKVLLQRRKKLFWVVFVVFNFWSK